MVGTLTASLGLAVGSVANNIVMFYAFYGVVTGMGLGLQFVALVVSLQLYFKKRIAIAMGVSLSGVGLGTFIFSPVLTTLIDYYGWRGAMLIMGGIFAQGIIFGALVRPLELPLEKGKFENKVRKTDKKAMAGSTNYIEYKRSLSENDENGFSRVNPLENNVNGSVKKAGEVTTRSLHFKQSQVDMVRQKYANNMDIASVECLKRDNPVKSSISLSGVTEKRDIPVDTRMFLSNFEMKMKLSNDEPIVKHLNLIHSIHDLSLHSALNICSIEPRTSQTANPVHSNCCSKLKGTLSNLFDFKAFWNVYIILFTLVTMQMCTVGYALYTFTPRKAQSQGLSQYQTSFMLSIVGVGDVCGRILTGIVASRIDQTVVYIFSNIVTGVFLMTSTLTDSFFYTSLCMFLAAVGHGGYVAMYCSAPVDYVGQAQFARAFGFLLLGNVLGSGVHAPLGACIYAASGSYRAVFGVLAALSVSAAALLGIVLVLRRLGVGTVYKDVVAAVGSTVEVDA